MSVNLTALKFFFRRVKFHAVSAANHFGALEFDIEGVKEISDDVECFSGLVLGLVAGPEFSFRASVSLFKGREPPRQQPPRLARALDVLRQPRGKKLHGLEEDLHGQISPLQATHGTRRRRRARHDRRDALRDVDDVT
jgi:hypothetical protein